MAVQVVLKAPVRQVVAVVVAQETQQVVPALLARAMMVALDAPVTTPQVVAVADLQPVKQLNPELNAVPVAPGIC